MRGRPDDNQRFGLQPSSLVIGEVEQGGFGSWVSFLMMLRSYGASGAAKVVDFARDVKAKLL